MIVFVDASDVAVCNCANANLLHTGDYVARVSHVANLRVAASVWLHLVAREYGLIVYRLPLMKFQVPLHSR